MKKERITNFEYIFLSLLFEGNKSDNDKMIFVLKLDACPKVKGTAPFFYQIFLSPTLSFLNQNSSKQMLRVSLPILLISDSLCKYYHHETIK